MVGVDFTDVMVSIGECGGKVDWLMLVCGVDDGGWKMCDVNDKLVVAYFNTEGGW